MATTDRGRGGGSDGGGRWLGRDADARRGGSRCIGGPRCAGTVGGGGHGLATAHYLARNHGITNVAVLERGWLAGGNMARNTTLIRSNYLWDESAAMVGLAA